VSREWGVGEDHRHYLASPQARVIRELSQKRNGDVRVV
jgi:hypothetical protein